MGFPSEINGAPAYGDTLPKSPQKAFATLWKNIFMQVARSSIQSSFNVSHNENMNSSYI
jgi:hypothetical protein